MNIIKVIKIICIFILILTIFDGVSTYLALSSSNQIYETNPVTRYGIENFGLLSFLIIWTIIKVIIYSLILKLLLNKYKSDNISSTTRKFTVVGLSSVSIILLITVLNNSFWYLNSFI